MPDPRRQLLVLCVTALLLTGSVLPVTATPTGVETRTKTESAGTFSTTTVQHSTADTTTRQPTALERKQAAIAVIESMDVGWRSRVRHRDRAIERLNGTRSAYRDGYRVSTADVFRDDRRALASLAANSRVDPAAVDRAAGLVAAADLATVDASIADAARALDQSDGRIDDPRDRRRADRALERAVRARDRAVTALDRDGRWAKQSTGRFRAIATLATAWRSAQRSIDVLDRATAPRVTILTRSDPSWNGPHPVTRTVRGNVTAVRAYELANVTVAVDGVRVASVPLDAPPVPARNASFAVNVTLDRPIAEVSATVGGDSDRESSRAEGRNGGRSDRFTYRGDGGWWNHDRGDRLAADRSDDRVEETRKSTAVVRFDGDGLPDAYETRVLGTDPLDPDSDSAATSVDESDDGTVDGGEDFDGDRLITFAEFELGTDPFESDTDGDGLPDRFEASTFGLVDATNRDTDGDGIGDGGEDFDGDGLRAAHEVANGTSVSMVDSDHDRLDDAAELTAHGTSPLAADTDGDGLDDRVEVDLGFDPLDQDTDGDGVGDGNETVRTATVDEETGVRIELSGTGDVASGVDVSRVSRPEESSFLAGPVVRIENRTAFDHAAVTIPIDGDVGAKGASNLSVYRWSPRDDRPWHRVNSTVENGTASANVTSFSFFSVMYESEWEAAITDTTPLAWPRFVGFEDLTSWSVDGSADTREGTLVVSGRGEADADHVVAKDGSGDFERIQPAVDAANDGDTILVRAGTYHEEVLLDASVVLVGANAVLDGSGLGEDAVGIRLVNETSATLRGITVRNYEIGVHAELKSTDVRIERSALRANEYGIDARGSNGDWLLRDATASGNGHSGIDGSYSTGDWTIAGTHLSGNGWSAIEAYRAAGNWTLKDSIARESGDQGISTYRTTGDWSFASVELARNGEEGITTYRPSGRWTLTDVELTDNGGDGINAYGSTGGWILQTVNVSGNDDAGIDAAVSASNWTVVGAIVTGNRGTGVDGYGTTGRWRVEESTVAGNDESGFNAYGAVGDVTIVRSQLHGNGDVDLVGPGDVTLEASGNWWGQSAGPSEGQTSGDVRTEPYCTVPNCGIADGPDLRLGDDREEASASSRSVSQAVAVEPFDARENVGPSIVRRELTVPAGVENATAIARYRGTGSRDSTSSIRVVGSAGDAVVAARASRSDAFVVEALDLSRFVGDTVGVEIVAEGDATVEVDWIDFAYDTDGDGLRDVVENADLGMPAGPRPGAPLAALDPLDPDTDGDGISDGDELTNVTLEPSTDGTQEAGTLRAVEAVSDPTRTNSDGGGLTDAEEREVGSDPFVLETLVTGYAIPTMTEGPGDTLEDRNPMTVGEANGLQAGGGPESDVIAWPAKQYFDPLFCIKELKPGPGCSEAWMKGVELTDDKHYVYVPFLVYIQSNVDLGEVPYELSFAPHPDANVVKEVNTSGTVEMGRSRSGYIVYELPEEGVGHELHRRIFRPLGELNLNPDLSNTVFERPEPSTVGRSYTVSTSTTLPRTEHMLRDTQFVLEQGINIAFAAEVGYSVAIETGSGARGALAFLYHLAKSQISTPPTSIDDVAKSIGQKGIAAFEEKVGETEGEIDEDVFEDGVVRTVGPTIIRQN